MSSPKRPRLCGAGERPGGTGRKPDGNRRADGNLTWKHPHQADGTVTYTRLEGGVTFFDGVDFGYDEGKLVLHDIRLYAEPGQKIASVGSTGAGKTTITNPINRFLRHCRRKDPL